MPLLHPYRNQSVNMDSKSTEWALYDCKLGIYNVLIENPSYIVLYIVYTVLRPTYIGLKTLALARRTMPFLNFLNPKLFFSL